MKTSISATTTKANTLDPLELLLLITACILCRQDLNNMSNRFMNHKIPDAAFQRPPQTRPGAASSFDSVARCYSRATTSQIPSELVSCSRKNKAANFGYIRIITLGSHTMVEFRR